MLLAPTNGSNPKVGSMSSPRPARRFSRWQTRKRTFVLGGTAFSTKKTPDINKEKDRRDEGQDVNEETLTKLNSHDELVPSMKKQNSVLEALQNTSNHQNNIEPQKHLEENSIKLTTGSDNINHELMKPKHGRKNQRTFESIARSLIEENENLISSVELNKSIESNNKQNAVQEKENDDTASLAGDSSFHNEREYENESNSVLQSYKVTRSSPRKRNEKLSNNQGSVNSPLLHDSVVKGKNRKDRVHEGIESHSVRQSYKVPRSSPRKENKKKQVSNGEEFVDSSLLDDSVGKDKNGNDKVHEGNESSSFVPQSLNKSESSLRQENKKSTSNNQGIVDSSLLNDSVGEDKNGNDKVQDENKSGSVPHHYKETRSSPRKENKKSVSNNQGIVDPPRMNGSIVKSKNRNNKVQDDCSHGESWAENSESKSMLNRNDGKNRASGLQKVVRRLWKENSFSHDKNVEEIGSSFQHNLTAASVSMNDKNRSSRSSCNDIPGYSDDRHTNSEYSETHLERSKIEKINSSRNDVKNSVVKETNNHSSSFHSSADNEVDGSGVRGLRNRRSIRKPPVATYPEEFLSKSQKRSLSLKSRKRIFDNTVSENVLGESQAEDAIDSSVSKQKDRNASLHSESSDLRNRSRGKKRRKAESLTSFTLMDQSADNESDDFRRSNISQSRSRKGDFGPRVSLVHENDEEFPDSKREDIRRRTKLKTSKKEKDTSCLSSENPINSVNQDNDKTSKRNRIPTRDSDVEDDETQLQSSHLSHGGHLSSKQLQRSEIRKRNQKKKITQADQDKSGSSKSKITDSNVLLISTSNLKNGIDSSAVDVINASDSDEDGPIHRKVKRSTRQQENNRSTFSVIEHNRTASLQEEVSIGPAVQDEPNRSLRERDSIRKPPPSHYPVEFLSSGQKMRLSSSKHKKSLFDKSTSKTASNSIEVESKKESPKNSNVEVYQTALSSEKVIKIKKQESRPLKISKDKSANLEKSKISKDSQQDSGLENYFPSHTEAHDPTDPSLTLSNSGKGTQNDKLRKQYSLIKESKHKSPVKGNAKTKSLHSELDERKKLKKDGNNFKATTTYSENNVIKKLNNPQENIKNSKKKKEMIRPVPSEQEKHPNTSVRPNNKQSLESTINELTNEELTSGNRSLRDRDCIRKPPTSLYPIEYLSSNQAKALSLLIAKKKGSQKDKNLQNLKETKELVKKRKYSLPRKKPTAKKVESFCGPEGDLDMATDPTLQVKSSLMMVNTFTEESSSNRVTSNNSDVGRSQVCGSQPLEDTIYGVHKLRRKRLLFSDSSPPPVSKAARKDQNTQCDTLQSTTQDSPHTSDDVHPTTRVNSKSKLNKEITKKSASTRVQQNKKNVRKAGGSGQDKFDAGENQASKTREKSDLKAKEVISAWMSSYQRFIESLTLA